MTKHIAIGDARIPLDSYAIGGTALLGIRASGKTYCAKGIAEQLLEHRVPIIVFDPIGTWRHLKVPANKHGKGYAVVVAGGRGADLHLTPQTATEIVRAAMRENIPLVVDLYDKTMSKSDWRRIVQTCFRTLLYENEGVRHIFLEEAAEYCPQKVQDGETYAEVEKLVRMGGNASLGITLINQRAQEVNKAVLDLCENLVLMRQMGAHAIDALEKWIDKVSPDFAGKIAAGMPKMTAGECWVFAGGAEKPIFTRSGTIRSYHPDRKNPDAKIAAAATDTSSFVEAMQRALPAIVEQQQANDPKKLKARIAELESMLRKAPSNEAGKIDTAELDAALAQYRQLEAENAELWRNVRGRNAELNKRRDFVLTIRKQLTDIVQGPLSRIQGLLDLSEWPEAVDPTITKPWPPVPAAKQRIPLPRAPIAASAPKTSKANGSGSHADLTGPQSAMLHAFYWLRNETASLATVSFYAGYKPGRYASDRVGELRTRGLVDGWRITAAGAALAAASAGEKPTGTRLREVLRSKLNGPQNKVLDVLIDAGGERLTLAEISKRTGYEEGRYLKDRVGELRTIEVAHGLDKDGGTRAAEVFFE